jgi:hypothetical protein
MKKTKIIYWIFTALLAAGMLMSAIFSLIMPEQANVFMTKLGYPTYLGPMLDFAKLLGVVALLVPGFPRIKEWAYAGFAFDLIGATYSQFKTGTPIAEVSFMLVWFAVFIMSYVYYQKKLNAVS